MNYVMMCQGDLMKHRFKLKIFILDTIKAKCLKSIDLTSDTSVIKGTILF